MSSTMSTMFVSGIFYLTTIFVIMTIIICTAYNRNEKEVIKMGLQNHLKEYRAKIDVNQQEFGKMVGVSRQTISLIERGDYSPSVTLAIKIAKVFKR